MKVVKLSVICFIFIFLSACATVPKAPEDASEVTFYFESGGKSVLTFWKKINTDGSKGKVFSVGGNSRTALIMNSGFKDPYAETIKLASGTYYLDSLQVQTASGFIASQDKNYNFRNGWDDENNKPLYLSFTVVEGKNLVLPKVEVVPVKQADKKGYYVFRFIVAGNGEDMFTFGSLAEK